MTCEQAEQNDKEFWPADRCEDNGKITAGCVCPKGLFFQNGKCVPFQKCLNKGWSEWGEWGDCDDTCARDVTVRVPDEN